MNAETFPAMPSTNAASDAGYLAGWRGLPPSLTSWTLPEAVAYLDGYREGCVDRADPFLKAA